MNLFQKDPVRLCCVALDAPRGQGSPGPWPPYWVCHHLPTVCSGGGGLVVGVVAVAAALVAAALP